MKNPQLVVGDTIRQLRMDAGMTQEQLAESSETHPNYISMVERGHRNPSLTNLLFIARALGVHPRELFSHLSETDLRGLPPKSLKRLRQGR